MTGPTGDVATETQRAERADDQAYIAWLRDIIERETPNWPRLDDGDLRFVAVVIDFERARWEQREKQRQVVEVVRGAAKVARKGLHDVGRALAMLEKVADSLPPDSVTDLQRLKDAIAAAEPWLAAAKKRGRPSAAWEPMARKTVRAIQATVSRHGVAAGHANARAPLVRIALQVVTEAAGKPITAAGKPIGAATVVTALRGRKNNGAP